jgi:hypothetical protein|tara:strand:- start:516 stop:629 length:114 start_codon:yes stop_codon:yes gene_type:complete
LAGAVAGRIAILARLLDLPGADREISFAQAIRGELID